MRAIRHILSAIIIIMFLCSALPTFSPEDANRDTRVSLEDAILHVRDFARTADKPATFTTSVKKALSTLYVVAGLNTAIRSPSDTKSTNTPACLDLFYLVSSTNFSNLLNNWAQITKKSFYYESIVSIPNSPPPRYI